MAAELRTRWAPLRSVVENNTLSEHWRVEPDTRSQWSHCAVAPLVAFSQGFAGVTPTAPGYRSMRIRPQPASLGALKVTVFTPHGPVRVSAEGKQGARVLDVEVPRGPDGELVVDRREAIDLPRVGPGRYRLPSGRSHFELGFT